MQLRFTLIDYTFSPAGDSEVIDEPIDWKDIKMKTKRDKWHGVDFEYSNDSIGFIGIGFSILKEAYDFQGVDAETELLVEIKCADTDSYEELYRGQIMYRSIKFKYGDLCIAECQVEQIGCLQTFRNRIEQQVDLDSLVTLDNTALAAYDKLGEDILLDAKIVNLIDQGVIDPPDEPITMSIGVSNIFTLQVPLDIAQEDFDALLGFQVVEAFTSLVNFCANNDGTLDFSTAEAQCLIEPTEIRIAGDISIDMSLDNFGSQPAITWTTELKVVQTTAAGNVLNTHVLDTESGNFATVGVYNFTLSGSIDVQWPISDTNKIFLLVTYVGSAFQFMSLTANPDSGNLIFYLPTQCEPTDAKTYFIHEALSRNAEIISDGCLKVHSEYFGRTDSQPYAFPSDGCGGLEVITNGLKLRTARKTDGSEPAMFVDFKKLFEGLRSIHNVGLGSTTINGQDVIEIEHIDHFYQFNVLMTLSDVKELELSFDKSRAYSVIEVGYNNWSSEFSGGLDEFLTTREYRTESKSLPTTEDQGKLKIVSELIASGYAIETTRRQGATTTDYKYDNNIFLICVERGGYLGFTPEIFNITASNLLSDVNVYNIRISPVRNLMRWYKSIKQPQWSRLNFNSGTGNYIADILVNGNDACLPENQVIALDENNNISPNLFKDDDYIPLWVPETVKFKYPLSWQQWKQIKEDPYYLIKVTQNNLTLYGWIDELTYEPNKGIGEFKLLLAHDAVGRI